jgi:hypothetical protein
VVGLNSAPYALPDRLKPNRHASRQFDSDGHQSTIGILILLALGSLAFATVGWDVEA